MNAGESIAVNMGVPVFTSGQIAHKCGISRQAANQGLAKVPPAGFINQNGKRAEAWQFSALPLDWQLEITRRGVRRGFEDGEHFLQQLMRPWEAPAPWNQIPVKEQAKALKLQKALRRALDAKDAGERTASEVEAASLEDFKAEFGYPVSARHWRRLMARTLERDAGERNWGRVEIYLDTRKAGAGCVDLEAIRSAPQHQVLDQAINSLENRADPSLADRAIIWDAVFRHYEQHLATLTGTGTEKKDTRVFKRSLVAYLSDSFPAGTLCSSVASLKRRFDEKLAIWTKGGRCPQAIEDKRPERSGRAGKSLCPECRKLVVGGAVDLDGDLSQAWRRLQLGRQLCGTCAELGSFDVRRAKSEVPRCVRRDVTPDILAALPSRRGPKHSRLVSPYILRNWSDIGPGDWAECDDMTPNHVTHGQVETLTWDQDADGRPFLGRMEVLVQIDRRTDYPWAYVIILGDPPSPGTPQRKATYNSVHCRLLFLRGHDQLGLPHKGGGFYLENSIWSSRLIDGPTLRHWSSNAWQRTEMGMRDPRIGLNIRHARPGNPRSKVIERMFLSIQNRMRCCPGFIGFNERADKREVMADFISRVKAGKEHPGNEIPQVGEFSKLLDTELMQHANEPQNGERLPGVSPMEAFHNGIGGKPGIKSKPLRQLGADARFLMSSHERMLPVTAQGIRFKVGATDFVFWEPALERYMHREVIARFNFEEPEILTCQAPDGVPFTVRAKTLPSTTATKEQLAKAAQERASWMRRGKVIFDGLPHPFRASITRDSEQSQETRTLGEFHNKEMQEFKEQKSRTARQTTVARKRIEQAGFDPDRMRIRNPEAAAEAAERFRRGIEELKRKEALEASHE